MLNYGVAELGQAIPPLLLKTPAAEETSGGRDTESACVLHALRGQPQIARGQHFSPLPGRPPAPAHEQVPGLEVGAFSFLFLFWHIFDIYKDHIHHKEFVPG